MNDNKSLLDTINSGFDIILNWESEPVVEEPEKVDIELVQDTNPKSTN
jgi:hypothetical protein